MTTVTSQALNDSNEKQRRKRCVFRRLRKTGRLRGRDVARQVVPGAGSGDRKRSVADSRQSCTADRQWCGQRRS